MLHPPAPRTTEEHVIAIYQALSRMDERLEAIQDAMAGINHNCAEEDERVAKLETWQNSVKTGMRVTAAIAATISTVVGLAIKFINP